MRTKVCLVQADDYSELVFDINCEIIDLGSKYSLKQIDYFQMEDNCPGQPSAIMIFEERKD